MLNRMSRDFAGVAMLLAVFTAPLRGGSTTATSMVEAADAPTSTVITVEEMCGGCVKQIKTRFDGVKGIAEVRCDVEKKTVTMIPAKGFRLSPRGLWEAMDMIGKTPTKLVAPSGVYSSKPKE